ncbi:U4/U6 small nuclear ribonucleoprotein Prp31 [Halotydeus destructor]|nr:U4/U6 small nuclear ribonucleoprotein Prp31 [Halotydeus destructor]
MSLADELLADLEDGDDVQQDEDMAVAGSSEPVHESMDVDMQVLSVRTLAKIYGSAELTKIMNEIEKRTSGSELPKRSQLDGPIESHPEYLTIVDANIIAVDIENEIQVCHKFAKEKYSKRFPELESLVPNALEYLMTAKELGNDLTRVKNNEKLQTFLTQATIMVVSVTASTTQGKPLNEEELASVVEACEIAVELNSCKLRIFEFVESRMSFIAPNLLAIVGANIAAKLMGIAGGLTNLSKMPSCNFEVLGSKKKVLEGYSSTASMPHTGFIYYSPLVQSTPPDLRRKAARLVANKATLATRADAQHSAPDGTMGKAFLQQIERALDKLLEPPPVKNVKALPAPIDQAGKKRGGKRVRRMKERMAMTEFRKQTNRMNFGDIEDDAYQNDLGFTTGTIGKSGKGSIRAPQIDEKTKVRISKTLQKNLQRQQIYGGTTTIKKQISGTASSIAFTPLQGLEIVNPQAAELKVNEANAKYFSNTSGFASAKPKTT